MSSEDGRHSSNQAAEDLSAAASSESDFVGGSQASKLSNLDNQDQKPRTKRQKPETKRKLKRPKAGASDRPGKKRTVTAYGLYTKQMRPVLKNQGVKGPDATKQLKDDFKNLGPAQLQVPATNCQQYDQEAAEHNESIENDAESSE